MTISDEAQVRAWCVDYALRATPPSPRARAETLIAEAKKYEAYVTNRPACEIVLVKPKRKQKG